MYYISAGSYKLPAFLLCSPLCYENPTGTVTPELVLPHR